MDLNFVHSNIFVIDYKIRFYETKSYLFIDPMKSINMQSIKPNHRIYKFYWNWRTTYSFFYCFFETFIPNCVSSNFYHYWLKSGVIYALWDIKAAYSHKNLTHTTYWIQWKCILCRHTRYLIIVQSGSNTVP